MDVIHVPVSVVLGIVQSAGLRFDLTVNSPILRDEPDISSRQPVPDLIR